MQVNKAFRWRFCLSFFILVYSVGFGFFYYKYVPLISSFQAVLIPVLFLAVGLTSFKVEWGILFFAFSFPLINNLPYIFKIYDNVPHAPTALVLFLAFFLGWLINRWVSISQLNFGHPVIKPLLLFSSILLTSAIITFLRYANFFPFGSRNIYDLTVNANGVRAGGALMSIVFTFLNYLTGFLLFFILVNYVKSKVFINKILTVLSISALVYLSFGFVQIHVSRSLGNTPFWVSLGQINSTFKDPNSFGVFLPAFFPIFLGMAFSLKKKRKLLPIGLIIFSLFVFPSSGSRSGFLGMIVAVVTFVILSVLRIRIIPKKKFIFATSLILILAVLSMVIFTVSQSAILYKRLGWSLGVLSHKISPAQLFTEKLGLWKVAAFMVRDFPLAGVGVGAYIVELPNYSTIMGLGFRDTDSAENYFFQVGAEVGVIGIILVLWLFYEILKQMRRIGRKAPADSDARGGNGDIFIRIGIAAAIITIFVSFLFHSYIGSYEVKYLFWLLISLLFVDLNIIKKTAFKTEVGVQFKAIWIIFVLLFGATHLWNSIHSLSLQHQANRLGIMQDFGFYKPEKDDRLFSFRWAKKSAGIELANLGPILVIPIMASHPDIEERPVKVRIYSADQFFRRNRFIKEISLSRRGWMNVEFPVPELSEDKLRFVFEASRDWQPSKSGGQDPRRLAFALGNEWFRYPSELSPEKQGTTQKTPTADWEDTEGQSAKVIYSNRKSQIKFFAEKDGFALRLLAKGQQALGLGPYIVIRLDGQIIGKTMLLSDDWSSLIFEPEVSAGEHVLSIELTNDFYEPELGQDRNVILGDLEVIYLR
jgi:hypothetical protein